MIYNSYKVYCILLLGFFCSCQLLDRTPITEHPDYVQDHQTALIFQGDSIMIDHFWKARYNESDTVYPYGYGRVSSKVLHHITDELLKEHNYDTIYQIGLFARNESENYQQWSMNTSSVENISVNYIENNQFHFDFYEDLDSLPIRFRNISDKNCTAENAFLWNKSTVIENPSLIILRLNKEEKKGLKFPNFPEKTSDSLYNLVNSYVY